MKKVASWTLLFSALLPIVVVPSLFISPMVLGKVVLIRGLAFLVVSMITLAIFFDKSEAKAALFARISTVLRNPIFIAMALSMLFLLFSTYFAYDRSDAFFGEAFRGEGFLTLFAFFCVSTSMAILFGKKEWKYFFRTIAVSSVVMLGFELRDKLSGVPRPVSLAGNTIFLAGFLIFSILSGCYLVWHGRREKKNVELWCGVVLALASVVGILLTSTRGTILGLAVGALGATVAAYIVGKQVKVGKKTLRFFAAVVLTVGILFSGAFLATRHATLWQRIPGIARIADTSAGAGSAASRVELTKISVQGFFDSNVVTVFFGWGWDNYIFFFQSHYNSGIYLYEKGLIDRAHDKLLDVLIMSGIVGFITYLSIWFFLFKSCLALMKREALLGLALFFFLCAYFVHNLFVFDVGLTYLAFYSVAAFLIFTRYERP